MTLKIHETRHPRVDRDFHITCKNSDKTHDVPHVLFIRRTLVYLCHELATPIVMNQKCEMPTRNATRCSPYVCKVLILTQVPYAGPRVP